MYIRRYIEPAIKHVSRTFPVLYLSGPRQVGKTTTLLQLAKKRKMNYVTLDNIVDRELAKDDPQLFLQTYPSPVLIDEVQYAPQLFPYIKMAVDSTQKMGSYWLTGSQQFRVMKNVHESLAGRVGILQLLGLSHAERSRVQRASSPFHPNLKRRTTGKRSEQQLASMTIHEVFRDIFTGSFPALWHDSPPDLSLFYNSYIQTTLDRDLSEIFGITKVSEFNTFLQLCAARTGQQLNYSDLARDAGVAVSTAKEWIGILESTMHIYLLRPYYKNISKRLIKSPKLYFMDTGLAAYLTKWKDADTARSGAMAGALFETFVVSEILKSYLFRGVEPRLYYFRDKEGHEIDLLIDEGETLRPIEIKLKSVVRESDLPGTVYAQSKFRGIVGEGVVVCVSPKYYPINRSITALPVGEIQ